MNLKTIKFLALMLSGLSAIGAAVAWTFVALCLSGAPQLAAFAVELFSLGMAAVAMHRAENYI